MKHTEDQYQDVKTELVILKDKYEAAHEELDWLGLPKAGFTVKARIEMLKTLIPDIEDQIKFARDRMHI